MNGSKARNIRKGIEQLFKLDPKQAIYNQWSVPEFAVLPQGTMKVRAGVPCKLINTCGRYKYQEMKKAYG